MTSVIPTGGNWIAGTFTTTIAVGSTPATFDARQIADGGQATASTGNTPLVNRFRKV
jgi:hypothetical protein